MDENQASAKSQLMSRADHLALMALLPPEGCDASELGALALDLAAGGWIDEPMIGQRTALVCAASIPCADLVQEILALGADPNAPSLNGWTALHAAAEKADARAVVALAQAGALLAAPDDAQTTPLAVAQGPASEALQALLEREDLDGASSPAQTRPARRV